MAVGLVGDPEETAQRMRDAADGARAAGDVVTETIATVNLASACTFSHRYIQAQRWIPVARELAERHEQLGGLGIAAGLAPFVRAMVGDLTGSLVGFEQFIEMIDEENQQAWGRLHMGLVLARLGQFDEAFELAEQAVDRRIGRAVDPKLVFAAAHTEMCWLADQPVDGETIRDQILMKNLHALPHDYLGRLGRNLQRVGVEVPPLGLRLAGYDQAMSGDLVGAARIWRDLGNPYEHGVELALSGDEEGVEVLRSIGASGAVLRISGPA
jgi:hypothetical protein